MNTSDNLCHDKSSGEGRATATSDYDHSASFSVSKAVLERNIPSSGDHNVRASIGKSWSNAAYDIRNIVSEESGRIAAWDTKLVKLLVDRIEYHGPGPSPHIHHCVDALVNIARHGDMFKRHIHNRGGLSAVAALAHQNNMASDVAGRDEKVKKQGVFAISNRLRRWI